MRSPLLASLLGLLALSSSCAGPGPMHVERTAVEDRVVFHFSVRGHRHSMAIQNLGPGPIEVVFDEGMEHTHPIEIAEGAFEYFRPGDLSFFEIRHPGEGSAEVEWSILERYREKIRVEALP